MQGITEPDRWIGLRVTTSLLLAVTMLLMPAMSGCKVSKKGKGENQKVSIETPLGSLKVNTQPDPKDTGLDVYPGARPTNESSIEHSGANVDIDSSLFGVKVVALVYETDDPPEKVLEFYRKQLRRFGEILECQGHVEISGHKGEGKVHCATSSNSKNVELSVGDSERRHIIEVEPQKKGAKFTLIYEQSRGERQTL